jgi:hypothetical protein
MRSFSPEDVQAYQAALDADFLRIERAFREVLRSEEAIREALARNRRHGPHLTLTFVNIPLKDAPVIRAELVAVHRLLERHLNDSARAKAYYQSAERAHTTLLRISGTAGVDEVFDEIRHEIDVAAFSYTLVGPHVTPDLIVVLELRASSASLMALRTGMRARLEQAGYEVPPQTISHVTVARLIEASQEELRQLGDACAARRTAPHEGPVQASRVCVSRSCGDGRYEDRCAPLGGGRISC